MSTYSFAEGLTATSLPTQLPPPPVTSPSSTGLNMAWFIRSPPPQSARLRRWGHNPSLCPQALSGSGRRAAGSISSPHLPTPTCENTSSQLLTPTSLGPPEPRRAEEAPLGKPHLATSSRVTASERNQTHRLGFWLRLFGELPKNSNLRVKGVWIGERLVKTSWRFTRVLSGTAAPKSRRSSSRRCSQGSVLRIPNTAPGPRAPGLRTALGPAQRATLGGGCESSRETRLCPRTHSCQAATPQTHPSRVSP